MKHAKPIVFIACILQSCLLLAQSPVYLQPIEGVYGDDFIIVNYVDWSIDSIIDHQCGSKTYDGHQGTDFVISGFPQMDEGVNVQAVDSGKVVFIHDGEPDRNTDGNPDLGLGNYIAIKHPDKHFSYYGHLKKYSILVNPGDSVVPGQLIGQVGSSGNSTDPHLHFELWYDSLYLVDPFAGPCGNTYSYWKDSIPYDTTFKVWDSGLTDYVTPIDSLRERPKVRTTFTHQDTIITFWNLQYGLKKGDSTTIEWITPNGNHWFDFTNIYQKDWWYYYYYSYIFTPPDSELGEWTYHYYYNDSLVLTGHFMLELPVNTVDLTANDEPVYKRIGKRELLVSLPDGTAAGYAGVYTVSGQEVLHKTLHSKKHIKLSIPKTGQDAGFYLIIIHHSKGSWTHKISF